MTYSNNFNLLLEINQVLEKYKNLRQKPKREFDQFFAIEETIFKRVDLLSKFSNIDNKILFLGDDDLTSIALALNKKFEKIFVVDIDKEILNLIKTVSENEKLNIKTIEYDLRKPLIELEKFNLIFFDPPYTLNAVKLWLLRALQISLGKGTNKKRKDINYLKNKFYFLCYGYTDKGLERGYKIQKLINDLGLIIQQKFRKFNKYTGAETINNESDLYILQPTPFINLSQIDSFRKKEFSGKIYTYE